MLCGSKIVEAMLFVKISLFFLVFHLRFLLLFSNYLRFYDLSLRYYNFPLSWSNFFTLNACLDSISLLFILIVRIVTFIVVIYSQVYIEHYNNKKFLFILILFFFSIAILSLGGSLLTLIIGWDGLGISSIFLIIFYPNKITLYNSILTIFFNRLGDVVLIAVLCHFIYRFNFYYFLRDRSSIYFLAAIFGLFVCGFTKSAQFPLSSWLPAAMSAPTPISAIVHSSTLVTAGIYLLSKFRRRVFGFPFLISFWFFFRVLAFLTGGFLANLELDFKKIVAFSTISQISMIIVFSSCRLISLALLHMLFHAFFKTLLFCCSGLIFITFYSLQQEKLLKIPSFSYITAFLFFVSIYSMTGLVFSSSFFSKDLVLEIFCTFFDGVVFFLFLLGRMLTLLYSSKILTKCMDTLMDYAYIYSKKFNVLSFLLFCWVILLCGKFFKYFLLARMFPFISLTDLYIILFLFFLSFFFLLGRSRSFMRFLHLEVSFMKVFTYRIVHKFFTLNLVLPVTFSSDFFFKTGNTLHLLSPEKIKSNFSIFMFVLIFGLALMSRY